jgi:hypothetical protein
MAPQALHVLHEMPRRIVLDGGIRLRASATALVEKNDAIVSRIVEAAHGRIAPTARPAVNDQHRFTVRIAAFGIIKPVPVAGVEKPLVEKFARRKKSKTLSGRHRASNSFSSSAARHALCARGLLAALIAHFAIV